MGRIFRFVSQLMPRILALCPGNDDIVPVAELFAVLGFQELSLSVCLAFPWETELGEEDPKDWSSALVDQFLKNLKSEGIHDLFDKRADYAAEK